MARRRAGSWTAMPTYLVERYLPGRDRAWLEAALARLPRQRRGGCVSRLDLRPCRRLVLLPVRGRDRRRRPGRQRARPSAVRTDRGRRRPVQPQRRVTMRFLALIAVLAVAASIAAASAQTKTRSGHDGKPSAGLELTYTKWVAPVPDPGRLRRRRHRRQVQRGHPRTYRESHLHSPDGHLHRDRS